VLFAAAAYVAPASAQDKVKLIVGSTTTTKWSLGRDLVEVLKPDLEMFSNGRIEVEMHLGGSLCNEQNCVEQMRLGQIDIATVSSGNVGAFGTTFDIINLPFLFKDSESASRILNNWLAKELSARSEREMKMHTIALVPVGGFRNLVNTAREVRVPADLNGIKIRVTKSPTEFNLVKSWGAIAVPYDWSALYEGLQAGVVQGMYLQDTFTSAGKFYEVVKYITHVGGAWSAHPILMDMERYNKLPGWAKDAIDKAGADLQKKGFAFDEDWQNSAVKEMQGKVKIYKPTAKEMALWNRGARDAWVAVKQTYDPALALRILEDQKEAGLIKELKSAGAL
jgi:TRAP-type C4-dicarboxylate transport system substrate-binding protein